MRRRARCAFTLMEVLLAVALVAALVGSMLAFLVNVAASRARAQVAAASRRAADVMIDRIESDLTTCIVGDAAGRAGIDGTRTSLRILTRGVSAPLALRESPQRTLGDLQLASYSFEAESQTLRAWRGPADDTPQADSMGGSLARIRFRYHDGGRWLDSFNSASERRLPLALEVAVWFHHAESHEAPAAAPDGANIGESPRDGMDEAIDEFASIVAEGAEIDEPSSAIDEPIPDRLRVIIIPDAADGGESSLPSEASS